MQFLSLLIDICSHQLKSCKIETVHVECIKLLLLEKKTHDCYGLLHAIYITHPIHISKPQKM